MQKTLSDIVNPAGGNKKHETYPAIILLIKRCLFYARPDVLPVHFCDIGY